jgi:hypothetical protein
MSSPNSNLGEPDLQFGPLQIWIHDRELLRPTYYDEENWLRITARFTTENSEVWIKGEPALLAEELEAFYSDARFNKRIKLETIEPYIALSFEPGDKNKVNMKVEMIPNPVTEKHSFLAFLSKDEYESGMKQIADIVKETHSIR